jgi:signal recognition particle GTPase
MPRYIDAELLDPEDFENCTPYQAREIIEDIPTADVVPKSEVERLEQILNSYALQYGTVKDQQAVIDKAKAEVAREIFEEIEEMLISSSLLLDCTMLIDTEMLAELKKKYTEGEPNGSKN